jgi:hypothetical protein
MGWTFVLLAYLMMIGVAGYWLFPAMSAT